jgi:phospholipase C
MNRRLWVFVLVAAAAIGACGGSGALSGGGTSPLPPGTRQPGSGSPIQHIIVVVQENRSFDNFFAAFPNADGATTGQAAPMPSPIAQWCSQHGQPVITQPTTVPLTKVTLLGKGFKNNYNWDSDLYHTYLGYLLELDSSKMDGFDLAKNGANGVGPAAECTYAYQYVDPKEIKPYWQMAKQYVLADHVFSTQGSSSFTGHQALIAGGTAVNYKVSLYGPNSVIDNPYGNPWGCDSPQGTTTALITTQGQFLQFAGPYPCFTYSTLRDLLEAKQLSWKYYAVAPNGPGPGIWSAFDAIAAVRNGPEWNTNVTKSPKVFFNDVTSGKLPAVSWITPDAANSDHPYEKVNGVPTDTGPAWVASIVNAIGQSKYWKTSAIVILWDDSGGFYDHEKPPFFDNQGGLGFRIPLLIVSPYVKAHIEHTQYETASVAKFIEQNFNLGGPLQSPDARAASLSNALNFTMTPRPFKKIQANYSKSFFLKQKPSGLPVDTE